MNHHLLDKFPPPGLILHFDCFFFIRISSILLTKTVPCVGGSLKNKIIILTFCEIEKYNNLDIAQCC